MSWSILFIGKPENVAKALEDEKDKMSGPSKEEYVDALPHLVGLVKQNFSTNHQSPIKISASGWGISSNDVSQRTLSVSIEAVPGTLV
ncbi:MAG TPA: hypothetical protein VK172_14820 [Lentimicrobium sp.]|nr:hypothetical protein [Bacteroidales bacterium]HLO92435.1 hypothetical protein [Lentimicrobium sp.]